MEDAHNAILDLQNTDEPKKTTLEERLSFFSVFDGHGGDMTAKFCGENVYKILAKQAAFGIGDYEKALKDSFLATDKAMLEDTSFYDEGSGSTVTAALFTNGKIYVANAGDSRAVLSAKGKAKPLSYDHKPWNEVEKSRITAAGGFVECGRVSNKLAMSRAIGNFKYKMSDTLPPEEQIVTAFPDVIVHEITDDDEFLVIACDGIWDCRSSQNVISFVRRGIVSKQELHTICENLMDYCLAPGSDPEGPGGDNMTMIVIGLLHGKTKKEWYDSIAQRVADGDGPCAAPEHAIIRGLGQPKSLDESPDREQMNCDKYKDDKGKEVLEKNVTKDVDEPTEDVEKDKENEKMPSNAEEAKEENKEAL